MATFIAAGILSAIALIEFLSLFKTVRYVRGFCYRYRIISGISTVLGVSYFTSFLKTQEPIDPHAYP